MKPAVLARLQLAKLKVVYDGHTVEVPDEDGLGLVYLYRRWRSSGAGSTFEVREVSGRLIALAERKRHLKSV